MIDYNNHYPSSKEYLCQDTIFSVQILPPRITLSSTTIFITVRSKEPAKGGQ